MHGINNSWLHDFLQVASGKKPEAFIRAFPAYDMPLF